jgi:hypothetical protein
MPSFWLVGVLLFAGLNLRFGQADRPNGEALPWFFIESFPAGQDGFAPVLEPFLAHG